MSTLFLVTWIVCGLCGGVYVVFDDVHSREEKFSPDISDFLFFVTFATTGYLIALIALVHFLIHHSNKFIPKFKISIKNPLYKRSKW